MAKHANPSVIGAFVLGALALATGGVYVFAGFDLFAKETSYVAYFESAVTGLDVGAPVRFQGVRVGRVGDIVAVYDSETKDIMIPVTLTFEEGTVRLEQELLDRAGDDDLNPTETIDMMIERGLKAELTMDSFVTGKLFVSLTYYPDEEPHYVNEGVVDLPEMPTTRSDIDKFVKSIEQLPIEELFEETRATIVAIGELVENPRIDEVLAKLSTALDEVQPVSASAQATLADIRKLTANVDRNVEPTVEDLRELLAAVQTSVESITAATQATLFEAQEALEPLDRILGRDYELPYRVQALLVEMAAATRSIRNLVEYLERHPEALLQGKR